MSLPSPCHSTNSLPNADPPTLSPPTSPSTTNALAVYALIIVTLLFSSFHQAIASGNSTSSFLFFSSTVITLAIVVVLGLRNSANSHRRWRNGAITSIVIYVCASTAALCSGGDRGVTVSASILHLGTLLFAVANVYSRRGSRDRSSLPLMTHVGSAWQVLVVLIADVFFLRSSLDRNALSFRITTASVTPAFLCHLSIIWLREAGYGCRFLEFNLIKTHAERCSFLLNAYALLLTFSGIFSTAYPLLKEIPIIVAFIGFTTFCAVTYSLIVYQEEIARLWSPNV